MQQPLFIMFCFLCGLCFCGIGYVQNFDFSALGKTFINNRSCNISVFPMLCICQRNVDLSVRNGIKVKCIGSADTGKISDMRS